MSFKALGNEQDEQHENDKEHNRPSGQATIPHKSTVHVVTPFLQQNFQHEILVAFMMRYKQDEQHENNQEHNCPSG
jgi:hypothetical protein